MHRNIDGKAWRRHFPPPANRLRLVLLAVLALTATMAGCGSSDSSNDSTAGRYVAEANLKHYGAETPQHTALAWWRAVQFANPGIAERYYARGAAPDMEQLGRELSAASSQFVGIPQFNSADMRAGRGTLYFFLGRPGSSAPPRPLSLNLVKSGGEWRLADNLLLEQQVSRVAKLLRERDETSG
jgi:uncharacterized protein YceK